MRVVFILAISLCLGATVPTFAQTREKKLGAGDFPTIVDAAKKSVEEKEYGQAMDKLKKGMQILAELIRNAVVEIMPEGKEGLVKQKVKGASGMDGFLAGSVGQVIKQEYRSEDGSVTLSITVHPNSPTIQMFTMALKMAAMQPDIEVVKYNEHQALFEKKNDGKRLVLKLLVSEKHYVEVNARGLSEDSLFEMLNQAFVDLLAKVLG